jgi:uncharacterized FlaG/YvyC family protein
MSNPLPPPAVNQVVRRETDQATGNISSPKLVSAESSAPLKQRPDDVANAKFDELRKLTEQAFATDDLRLSISFEKSIGRFVYRGVDRETGEVVREYPQEEVIKQIAHLREIAGITIDRRL